MQQANAGNTGFTRSANLSGDVPGRLTPSGSANPFSPVPKEVRGGYLRKLRSLFDIMDVNGNNELELDEFFNFLQKLCSEEKIAVPEVEKLMHHFDTNRSGAIEFPEFVLLAEQMIPLREVYAHVIAGEAVNAGDEMTEEMKAGLVALSPEAAKKIQEEAVALSPNGKPLTKRTLEELRELPLHYGTERYECSLSGITAENMNKGSCRSCSSSCISRLSPPFISAVVYVAPEGEAYVLCSICGEEQRERRIEQATAELQNERRVRPVRPSFMPAHLKGHPTPSEKKADARAKIKAHQRRNAPQALRDEVDKRERELLGRG
ncbi:unnamed protein product [Amoebophrya sp. A25]|nr:unnamed protein product [Amoebophrya sp. A25]|eukprot:GSA25T00007253001.1